MSLQLGAPRTVVLALILAGLTAGPAAGQSPPTPDFAWNNFVSLGTLWSNGNNWLPMGPPTGDIDRVLGFGSSPLQTAGGYTSTYDLGAFDLNSLVFTSSGASNPSIVLTGSAATDTLRFNTSLAGTLPSIWQTGSGRVVIQNGNATAGITLFNGTTLRILGAGIGEVQLNATIAQVGVGNSGLLINQTGTRPLFTGSTVRLGGANTFAGGVTLTAGNLVIANNAALGTGTFTVNGGTVQFDPAATTGFTVANPVTLNGTLVVTGTSVAATVPNPVATFSGPIGGPDGITLSPTGGGINYAFTGANTFAGAVTIRPIGNTVTNATFGTSAVATGTAAGASGFSVYSNSTLTLNNLAGAATRLNTAVPPTLALHRANLTLAGNATADVAEAFGALTVSGMGAINVIGASATARTTTVTFASLTRVSNGTLALTGTNMGSGTGAGESIIRFTADPGGAVGGGGAPGTTTVSILPYAYAESSASTATAAAPLAFGLVRWDAGTQRIIPLSPSNEYATNLFTARNTSPAANHRYASTAAAPNAFGVAGLVGPATVNAVVLDTNTAAPPNRAGVSLEGPGTLTVAGGAVVVGVNGGNTLPTNRSMINLGGLSFGASPGYLHTAADLVITSPVSGSGGLVKSGAGTLVLTGANPFTGGLTLNAGPVQFTSDTNLGAAAQPVHLTGGLTGALVFQPNNLFGPATATAETVNRPVTLGPAGGQVSATFANSALTLSGPISGTGQFVKAGAGVLNLTGTNTFTGNTVVAAGILAAQTDAALGDPAAALVLAGGTFQPNTSFATGRTALVTASSFVFTNGQTLTINGNVTSQTSTPILIKTGLGDLVLTGANTFTGAYQNGETNGVARATAPAGAQTPGRTILTGADGALPLAASVLSLAGGEIVLDNAAAVNNNRIGSVTIGAIGGNLTLIGNATAPVNEAVGALSVNSATNPYGGTLTLVTPAGSGQSTTLTATAFAVGNPATLFVRGTNLGAATGDRTAVVFGAVPTQVNGLIPAMVGATSATGEPTDFLTTQTVTVSAPNSNQFTLVPFTNYSASPLSGAGSATATFDVAAPASVTGASGANALRIRGGSVDVGGGTLTVTSGAVLATSGPNGGIANGTLAFGGNPARFTVAAGSGLTVSAQVTGTGGLNKTGGGVLTLASPATTTGTISITQGSLRYGVADALPAAAAPFVNGGATLDLNGNPGTLAAVQGYGTVNLGTGTLTLNSATAPAVSFSGGFAGSGTLVKDGTNAVVLNGDSPAFTGGVTILRGTLAVNGTGSLGTGTSPILLGATSGTDQAILTLGTAISTFSRDITVQAGSTPATPHTLFAGVNTMTLSGNISLGQLLRLNNNAASLNNTGNATLTGTVSGNGGLFVFLGTWSLWGNNTYSGGTTLDMGPGTTGMVGVGSDSALGTGPVTFTSAGGFLRADNGPRTLANPIVLQPGAYFGVTGTNNLTLTGSVDLSAATAAQAVNVISTGTTTLGGVISNGTGGVTKNGPGALVLAGANTYSGPTTVNAGTLLVNNTSGSGTGAGNVVVNSGAILGGSGTVGDGGARSVAVNAGGIVRPGPSLAGIGTLTINSTANVAFAPGSVLQVNVGASPSAGGRLAVTGGGTADLSGLSASAPLTVYLAATPGVTLGTPYSLTVIDSGATPVVFPGGGFSPALFNVVADFDVSGVSVTNPTPGTIVLGFTPVPEPGILLLIAGSAVAFALRRVPRSARWAGVLQ